MSIGVPILDDALADLNEMTKPDRPEDGMLNTTVGSIEGIRPEPSKTYLNSYRVYKKFDASEFDPMSTGFVYIFFVTPDLNLDPQLESGKHNVTYLKLDHLYKPNFYTSLTRTSQQNRFNKQFIKSLTNLSMGIDESDYSADAPTAYENFSGHSINISAGKGKDHNPTFSIKYLETKELYITNLHTMWLDYIYKCKRGYISRSDQNIENNILDYASSVYVFHTEPDGKTITYWSKYTGVVPTSLPYASNNSDDSTSHDINPTVSVDYVATARESMNYKTLLEFSRITKSGSFDTSDKTIVDTYNDVTEDGTKAIMDNPELSQDVDKTTEDFLGSADGMYVNNTPTTFKSCNEIFIAKLESRSENKSFTYKLLFK